MIRFLSLLLFLVCFKSSAQVPNLIENGDFTKGKAGWEGKGRIIKLKEGKEAIDGNPALMIELDNKKEQRISQIFKVSKETKSVKIHYKIRTSSDFESSSANAMDVTLWGGNTHFDGLVYREKLERTEEWKEKKASTEIVTDKIGIEITLKPGKGKIYFDDFFAEAN